MLAGNVLLAEDNLDNQKLISLYVRRTGAELTVVEDGAQAVREAMSGNYALVLMDMQMPVMDGFEATRELRRRGYMGQIVALTAGAMREDVDRCLAAGCDDYLAKPLDRARFYALLAGALIRAPEVRSGKGAIVSTLLEEDPEMADLLEVFLGRLPQMIRNIDGAVKARDWTMLKRLAHDLKSVGGNYGYLQLTQAAAKIEFEMVKESYASIPKWVAELYELEARILEGAGSPAVAAGRDGEES
jgi:CheY-like chemotaxis protein